MGDEIMKAYTCGARAIFVEPPEKCPLLKDGNCEDGTPCDAAEVEVLPAAEYEAMEAALAAAEKALSCGIGQIEAFMGQVKIGSLNSGAERQLVAINDDFIKIANDALARLRALGKG